MRSSSNDWEAQLSGNPSAIGRRSFTADAVAVYIAEKLLNLTPKRVLEIGCGDGFFPRFLKWANPGVFDTIEYVGVDRDCFAISEAQARMPEIALITAEFEDVRLKPADVIVCLDGILTPIPSLRLVGNVAEHLLPGGKLILSAGFCFDADLQRRAQWASSIESALRLESIDDLTLLNIEPARRQALIQAASGDERSDEGAIALRSMAEGSYHHAVFIASKQLAELPIGVVGEFGADDPNDVR